MEFFEEKKEKPNQPLDELLTDRSVLDDLMEKFDIDQDKGENDSSLNFQL